MKDHIKHSKKTGFTIIELMLAIIILGGMLTLTMTVIVGMLRFYAFSDSVRKDFCEFTKINEISLLNYSNDFKYAEEMWRKNKIQFRLKWLSIQLEELISPIYSPYH